MTNWYPTNCKRQCFLRERYFFRGPKKENGYLEVFLKMPKSEERSLELDKIMREIEEYNGDD